MSNYQQQPQLPSHQPQPQRPATTRESESEQQAQSEPSKSPQPQMGGYEHSDLSRFNSEAAAVAEAAALQAASLAAASYDMYQQPPSVGKNAASMASAGVGGGGANSANFYPWMKNYNGE